MARTARRSRPAGKARKAAGGAPAARKRAASRAAPSRPSRPARGRAGPAIAPGRGVRPLDFTAGDERSGRAGDARPRPQQREDFPASRVREAGLTAAETPHPERNTADDLAPDTLLDDEGGQSPADQRGPRAADSALSVVDESAIGAGDGADEAEDARRQPIGRAELERIRERVARAGSTVNDVEPNEARARRRAP